MTKYFSVSFAPGPMPWSSATHCEIAASPAPSGSGSSPAALVSTAVAIEYGIDFLAGADVVHQVGERRHSVRAARLPPAGDRERRAGCGAPSRGPSRACAPAARASAGCHAPFTAARKASRAPGAQQEVRAVGQAEPLLQKREREKERVRRHLIGLQAEVSKLLAARDPGHAHAQRDGFVLLAGERRVLGKGARLLDAHDQRVADVRAELLGGAAIQSGRRALPEPTPPAGSRASQTPA